MDNAIGSVWGKSKCYLLYKTKAFHNYREIWHYLDFHENFPALINYQQTLEISGRLQFLHGHSRNFQLNSLSTRGGGAVGVQEGSNRQGRQGVTAEVHGIAPNSCSALSPSSFGLFGVCSPLGSLPNLDGSQRETSFKTKHKMDLTITSMDTR